MTSGPEVSVIIPTIVRDLESLDTAVTSALTQDPPPVEVIVVDDRVGQPALVLGDDERVRVILNAGPHGPAGARNCGVAAARGELVAFLDDDDRWLPGKLAAQLAQLAAADDPGCVVVGTRARVLARTGTWLTPEELPDPSLSVVEDLFLQPEVRRARSRGTWTSTMLAPRSMVLAVLFDTELTNWEDVDWLVRMTDQGCTFVVCPEPLVEVRHDLGEAPSQSHRARADASRSWADRVIAPRSRRAHHNFLLTYVVRLLVAEGRRAEAVRLGLRTASSRDVDVRPLVKFISAVALTDRMTSRLANLSSGSFRGSSAGSARNRSVAQEDETSDA
ncbi:glycosyltransferase family 2 protein [Janibacter sp. YIM B02568]|uniref:glycosyltransferase family 2 protein n=1 Tax=Janibacter endophyticus TaxID=2806261 RepID=UPI00194F1A96|nr:glycosyltransferase family A protein [Janibacter endophyticus]MBM6547006.1 glycosyltransferase family 2 protein [Janibacter endophyticus]